jgi:3',5'-cyclic AMP phosphodiesterase CpdA
MEAIKIRGMRPSVVLGNHDKAADFRGLDGIGDLVRKDGLYYERTVEGTLCLFLDSSSSVIGRAQFAWIEEQAKKAKGSNLAIFVHHPVLDCGGTLMDQRYPLKNREEVAAFLAGLDLDVSIFCGHYHTDHVQRHDRITQYVTPALSVQFKSHASSFQVESKRTAYRLIELDAGKLKTELVALG